MAGSEHISIHIFKGVFDFQFERLNALSGALRAPLSDEIAGVFFDV
jgi:hypothetical protein